MVGVMGHSVGYVVGNAGGPSVGSLVGLLDGSAEKLGSMAYVVLTLVWQVNCLTLVNLELTFLPGLTRIHSSILVSSDPRRHPESESDSESDAFTRSLSSLEESLW